MRQRLSNLGFISCAAALMACVGANAATSTEAASITAQMSNTAVIYSNTEEVYFDAEAGKEAPPIWMTMTFLYRHPLASPLSRWPPTL
jgi:hypothetical protein